MSRENLLDIQEKDSIGVIYMNRPPCNFLDAEFLEALTDRHRKWADDPNIRAVILTSEVDKFFSNGLDVDYLVDAGNDEKAHFFNVFLELINTMYNFDKPHLSAINGSAMAGGAILASLSDFRFMAEGPYRIAFPEVKIGLGLPEAFLRLIETITGPQNLVKTALLGEAFKPNEALETGLVDELLNQDELISKSTVFLQRILRYPDKSFTLTKNQMRKSTRKLIQKSEKEIIAFFKSFFDENLTEGLSAVRDKRRPNFKLTK